MKKTTSPCISVIMPVYNGEKTIAGAVNSIKSQTYENWELIIVDDGSTDKTHEEVQRFLGRQNIKFFKRPNGGIPATRNFGNQMAKGTYCIVQDADDYSMPDRLEKVIEVFKATNADVVVHGTYINGWDDQYQCLRRIYSPPLSGKQNCLKNRINGCPAYKRGVWEKRPFREETKYSYDFMMHLDWTLSGFKYETLNEGLYEYVRYAGSASDRFEKSGLRAEAFKKIKQIVKEEYDEKVGTNIK